MAIPILGYCILIIGFCLVIVSCNLFLGQASSVMRPATAVVILEGSTSSVSPLRFMKAGFRPGQLVHKPK